MSPRTQAIKRRWRETRITGGHGVVLNRPGAGVQLVIEGIIRTVRQVNLDLEGHVRRRRQGEVDQHLAGRRIRRRRKVLVRTVVRPHDKLTARGARLALHRKRCKQALA